MRWLVGWRTGRLEVSAHSIAPCTLCPDDISSSRCGYAEPTYVPAASQLFLGDTNRTICETPMNMASSRSHCMFMVHFEARKVR